MNKSRGLGLLSIAVALSLGVGMVFLSGEEASASEESCRSLWHESSAAESCGPPSYPNNAPNIVWEEQGDTCQIRVPCKPYACPQDITVWRSDVKRLHNCDCTLKVGFCSIGGFP